MSKYSGNCTSYRLTKRLSRGRLNEEIPVILELWISVVDTQKRYTITMGS